VAGLRVRTEHFLARQLIFVGFRDVPVSMPAGKTRAPISLPSGSIARGHAGILYPLPSLGWTAAVAVLGEMLESSSVLWR
jgi:hypothetical protein